MSLQLTGPISLGEINTELGNVSGTIIRLGETSVRNLLGKLTGIISLSDAYGKAIYVSSSSFSDEIEIVVDNSLTNIQLIPELAVVPFVFLPIS